MSLKFELTQSDKGEFFFKLLDASGATLVRSEGYNAKTSANNGIESVRKNGGDTGRYDLKDASDGRPYFNLKAGNGQIIGTSPMFKDGASREAALAALKAGVATAPLDDKT